MGKFRWPVAFPIRGYALGLAITAFPGCAFVSTAEHLDKLNRLDQDGDGEVDKEDCADLDDTRSHLLPEIPLNGIDDNCDGFDVIDQDCDGFPTISRSDYETQFPIADFPEAIWPVDVNDGAELDCNDGVLVCDCDGTEQNPGVPVCFDVDGEPAGNPETISATTHPGAADAWYDGVDADCAEDDDYDRDGDGYVRPTDSENSELPALDCDDTNKSVHGGDDAPADAWYDGIDSDCDKANDFDQDGDGYLAIGFDQADLDDFREYYDYTEGDLPDALGDQDCVDGAEGEVWTGGGAEDIHPDATEVPYDGVDSNCDESNDYDVDGDGYIHTDDEAAFQEYLVDWGYDEKGVGFAGLGECDDDDALIYPGRSEILGDAADQDCDGLPHWSPMFSGDYTWAGVGNVVAARNGIASGEEDAHFVLAARANWFSGANIQGTPVHWPGIWMAFEADSSERSTPVNTGVWHNASGPASQYPIGDRIDIEPVVGEAAFYAVSSHIHDPDVSKDSRLYSRRISWNGSTYSTGSNQQYEVENGADQSMHDVDIHAAENGIWMLGCADSLLSYHRAVWNGTSWSSVHETLAEVGGTTCMIEELSATTAEATVCSSTECTEFAIDSEANTITEGTTTAGGLYSIDRNNGWITTIHNDQTITVDDGETTYELFDQGNAIYADVASDDSGVYAVAVLDTGVDGAYELWFGYGDPSGTWNTVSVEGGAIQTETGEFTSASIAIDDDRVFIATSLTGCPDVAEEDDMCDRVYWTMLDK